MIRSGRRAQNKIRKMGSIEDKSLKNIAGKSQYLQIKNKDV